MQDEQPSPRAERDREADKTFFFGAFRFDSEGLLLFENGSAVLLGPKPLAVLKCLLERTGEVVSKQHLIATVWHEISVTEDSLGKAINRLRHALADDLENPVYIQTIHRRGYRFIAEVTVKSQDEVRAATQKQDVLGSAGPPGTSRRSWTSGRRAYLGIAGLVAVALLVGVASERLQPAVWSSAADPVHLGFTPSPADEIRIDGRLGPLAFSPDGTQIAYVGQEDGTSRLYLKNLDEALATVLVDTEGASNPVFSPDGQWIAFFDTDDGSLKKVSAAGGAPITLCEAPTFKGATWGPDDRLVVGMRLGLWSITANGDHLTELVTADIAKRETNYQWPDFLPNGEAVLFAIVTSDDVSLDDADVAILFLDTGKYEVLFRGGTNPRYAEGYIIYARANSLLALEFDMEGYRVTGPPFEVQPSVATFKASGGPQFALSRSGSLAYVSGTPDAGRTLLWVGRDGTPSLMSEHRDGFNTPSFSPDGKRLAVDGGYSNHFLWVYDIERDDFAPLTHGWDEHAPVWINGGSGIAFSSNRAHFRNVFRTSTEGNPAVLQLTSSERLQTPTSWSSAYETLAFTETHPDTGNDIWLVSTNGESEAEPFLRTESREFGAAFSRDGRFIAYTSDESGQLETYVQTFPTSATARVKVSRNGGRNPRWSSDGSELFFWNLEGGLMAVPIDAELTGEPEFLFDGAALGLVNPFSYDVHPDGRFVIIRTGTPQVATEIHVVLNWFEELKQRVPTGGR